MSEQPCKIFENLSLTGSISRSSFHAVFIYKNLNVIDTVQLAGTKSVGYYYLKRVYIE